MPFLTKNSTYNLMLLNKATNGTSAFGRIGLARRPWTGRFVPESNCFLVPMKVLPDAFLEICTVCLSVSHNLNDSSIVS